MIDVHTREIDHLYSIEGLGSLTCLVDIFFVFYQVDINGAHGHVFIHSVIEKLIKMKFYSRLPESFLIKAPIQSHTAETELGFFCFESERDI